MVKLSKKAFLKVIRKSLLSLIVFLLFIWGYIHYKIRIVPTLSSDFQQDINKYAGTIFIICIGFVMQRITCSLLELYKENIASKTETQLDDKLIHLLYRTVNIIIWAIALLVILPLYGINISALVAALGVGSLAIALAAQDTIANIIAGFLIMIDTPFRIGDRIKLPSGEIAKVLDIGVRRSRFLSEDKAIIIVPNLDLSKSKIINYTYGKE